VGMSVILPHVVRPARTKRGPKNQCECEFECEAILLCYSRSARWRTTRGTPINHTRSQSHSGLSILLHSYPPYNLEMLD